MTKSHSYAHYFAMLAMILVAAIIVWYAGEAFVFYIGDQRVHQFVNHSSMRALMVVVGQVLTGAVTLWVIYQLIFRLWFGFSKDSLGNEERKKSRRAGLLGKRPS